MKNETVKHAAEKMKAVAEKAMDKYKAMIHKKELDKAALEKMKEEAALAALDYIEEDTVVGVGTGSTVNYFIEGLRAFRGKIEGVVASSEETAARVKAMNIPLIDLNSIQELPLYVDGADEVGPFKRLIKGAGGALTREKILASAAKKFVCIIDQSKQVDLLGTYPVPVEVIPMSRSYVGRQLVALGGEPVYRQGFVTDNGHFILDVFNLKILDPVELEQKINRITGVVENGIFAQRTADVVLVGKPNGVERF